MKLVTKQDRIDGVADAWKDQYFQYLRQKIPGWQTKKAILDALRALPTTATEDNIADIIGNRSWTAIRCDECDKDVSSAVEMGDPMEYHEGNNARLCRDCLERALGLFEVKA